ncbi:hypothetical protein GQ55_1G221900 [Panicum hallii var. hallii]|uniref:Uncharacterized protein n=1 Tax=Panicum hallii var. hallii TaxID=1504633 RepID=A0A2T7F6I8_9POAL|nr:hypothetical protein GQ55_1G221900 [Panicum hallii var. hallii]
MAGGRLDQGVFRTGLGGQVAARGRAGAGGSPSDAATGAQGRPAHNSPDGAARPGHGQADKRPWSRSLEPWSWCLGTKFDL